jgi:anaerobic magnesium-protoporphyrin IX monomethyl ester cyclase
MKVLLINTPSRMGKEGLMLPLGLLYVSGIMAKCGFKPKILDPYLADEDRDIVADTLAAIDEVKPIIVGYGGIATSYGLAKTLSLAVKAHNPEVVQIAGGALSSVYELLLTHTGIDIVFHGETEVSLPLFLAQFAVNCSYEAIPGISYLRDGEVLRNAAPPQIENLDCLPPPRYDLVDMRPYLHDIHGIINASYLLMANNPFAQDIIDRIGEDKYYMPIVTSRGCTHKCSFCYRHFKGYRKNSVEYVIGHIKYLMNVYHIRGFQFVDELFNSDYDWVMRFCDALEHHNLNIYYLIGGARVNKVDEKMLHRLKQTGCIGINYGQESGSEIILHEYRKGVSVLQNRHVTRLTMDLGIISVVQLVIGSPSETTQTIYDNIQFLQDVNAYSYSLNYLIPLPGTPIWKYVTSKGLITDVEEFLYQASQYGGTEPIVNVTARPDYELRRWENLIEKEMLLFYYRKTKDISYRYKSWICGLLNVALYFASKHRLKEIFPPFLRTWINTAFRKLK